MTAFYGHQHGGSHVDNKQKNIDLLKKHYVPVSIDDYLPGNKAEVEFIEKTEHQVNGWTYMTAGGKVLAKDQWLGADSMERALEEFQKLPEQERKPDAGKATPLVGEKFRMPATPPPGGLIARVYTTPLERDDKGELFRAKRYRLNGNDLYWVVEPSLTWHENFWMTEKECRAMALEGAKKGDKVSVPASVQTRIFTYHLGTHSIEGNCPGEMRRIRAGELTMTVEEASSQGVRLRLDGYAKAGREFDTSDLQAFGGEFRLLGFLNYDARKKAFDRFDLVVVGEAWGGDVNNTADPMTPNYVRGGHDRWPVGIAFELVSGAKPVDRIPPYWANEYIGGKGYMPER